MKLIKFDKFKVNSRYQSMLPEFLLYGNNDINFEDYLYEKLSKFELNLFTFDFINKYFLWYNLRHPLMSSLYINIGKNIKLDLHK
jgi:hypothetical protein